MTFYEGLSLVVAFVALAFSGAALWISIPLQRLQRRELEEASQRRKQADVRITLVGSPASRPRFVIENRGEGAAYDVSLDVTPPPGWKNPLDSDYLSKIPIATLMPGDPVQLRAKISGDTGTIFNAKWSWRTEDGSTEERANAVSLVGS